MTAPNTSHPPRRRPGPGRLPCRTGPRSGRQQPQRATPATPRRPAARADLEARHAELSDAFLRAKAEAENIRRRAEEEVAKARKYAVESFAESLLPVKDSLEAAISIPAATTEQMLEGVHATLRQLSAALERNKVARDQPGAGVQVRPAPAPGDQRRAGRRRSRTPSSRCCRRAT